MSYPALPQVLEDTTALCRPESQPLIRNALNHLWFDACKRSEDGSVFVQTGDIPAMWIRDSTWQVMPLVRFAADPEIASLISGVIQSQVKYLSIDPYANAFNQEPNGACWHKDFEEQSPWVFERKWELDSISGFLALSHNFEVLGGSEDHLTPAWFDLFEKILDLIESEQNHEPQSYRFVRQNAPAHDYLSHDGFGAPFEPCGLVWDAFRPSDDACELPFHVPSNIHLAVELSNFASLRKKSHPELAKRAARLSKSIGSAIKKHAVVKVNGRKLFAYEVDGKGGSVLMDDANYPNLVSVAHALSRLDRKSASNTVEFVYSPENPWYFSGSHASGVGSPHTGKNMVWPLSIAMRGLVTGKTRESRELIERTVTPDLNIHESFNVNDPSQFTREWFSWAEMTYVELAFSEL